MRKAKNSKEYDTMLFEYIEKELGLKDKKNKKQNETKEQEVKV